MDEKQKLNIIENLIENRFDKNNFSEFISNVLNVTVRNRKDEILPWKEYQKYVESYQIFGDYKDSNNQDIYIVAIKIKESLDPTRAKTKQREIIAKILRESQKDGALVAFFNEDETHWRMAFVKLEYSFTAKGLEEKLTPAKRLSYVIGEGEASHTVKKQFMILKDLKLEVTLNELEELFKLEKVTDRFFDEYKKKYLDLQKYLETNEEFMKEAEKQDSENPESFSEGFAKKLMGQIAVLYFLQKKGWLGVEIVPEKLTYEEYYSILEEETRSNERDTLINSYEQKDVLFILSSEVRNYSIEDANILANCFVKSKFDEKLGTGDKQFIRNLFKRHLETDKEKTFFNGYLEELFYEALNLDRGSNQYFKKLNYKIPFLNGGLFEPYGNYDWKNVNFELSDALFSNENDDGILDIFDRYNFTISENEPYETEVAVDPEMLGKVFENLLDVNVRKSKGAFYTPREIVQYMCKESLINYLLNEIKEVNREDVEYLIQLGEFTREYDEHLFEKDYMDYLKGITSEFNDSWGMPESIRKNAPKIDSIIKGVRVADPAIGSGAFPLGMLNEIVKVRNILTQYILFEEALKNEKLNINLYRTLRNKKYNERSLYNLKIETIENSLYGVDIEPSAVDIAKLRLWLSIVVDTKDNDIRPLPNLDFNFMVGNSLIDEFDGVQLFDEKLITKKLKETYTKATNKLFNAPTGYQKDLFGGIEALKADIMVDLEKYHKAFFKERNTDKKKEIKNEIEKLEWLLITETLIASGNQSKIKELEKLKQQKRKPYFLWKLEFAKVFQEKGGFDIMIGNPPYVNIYNIENELKNSYIKNFKSAKKKFDLYVLFMEKSLNLLNSNGISNLITSNKWLSQSYGHEIRKIYLQKEILKIINFKFDVFKSAKVNTCISIVSNKKNESKEFEIIDLDYNGIVYLTKEKNYKNIEDSLYNNDFKKIEYGLIKQIEENNFRINLTEDIMEIINHINFQSLRLDEICYINYGLRGNSEKLKVGKDYFVKENNETGLYKSYFEGKNIEKWKFDSKLYFDYQPELHYNSMFTQLFENIKLVSTEVVGKSSFKIALDKEKRYNNHTVINILKYELLENVDYKPLKRLLNEDNISTSKEYSYEFILGCLNSKIIYWYFLELLSIDLHFYPNYVKQLPIPKLTECNKILKEKIELKVKELLENTEQSNILKLEEELNRLVYEIYSLPEQFKNIIDKV